MGTRTKWLDIAYLVVPDFCCFGRFFSSSIRILLPRERPHGHGITTLYGIITCQARSDLVSTAPGDTARGNISMPLASPQLFRVINHHQTDFRRTLEPQDDILLLAVPLSVTRTPGRHGRLLDSIRSRASSMLSATSKPLTPQPHHPLYLRRGRHDMVWGKVPGRLRVPPSPDYEICDQDLSRAKSSHIAPGFITGRRRRA
ncbi:hypothetical protein V8F06_007561 [Rhypophila decipiens]